MAKQKLYKKQEEGKILLITTIVLLVLTIGIASCMKIAGRQLELAILERETSNTYYLAKSGIEKQVDAINKALVEEMPHIVWSITEEYINQLAQPGSEVEKLEAMEGNESCKKYEAFKYDQDTISIINKYGNSKGLQSKFQKQIYDFITKQYVEQSPLVYEVQGDYREPLKYKTVVTIKTEAIKTIEKKSEDEADFRLIATAQTKNIEDKSIYDDQTVIADIIIDLPEEIPNEIHEKYTWATKAPEILSSGLISFSDVVITDGGILEIENGAMQVKGSYGPKFYHHQVGDVVGIAQKGGVVVSNGGQLYIRSGDLACVSNVIATNGWFEKKSYDLNTNIIVERGDMIASTIGIIDDNILQTSEEHYGQYKKGSNLRIKVGGNIFTSDDVIISKDIRDSEIYVGDTIFGINDGSHSETIYGSNEACIVNPNTSSGVFSQGENTVISAEHILVNGQPYMVAALGEQPMKLWESVGEPFISLTLGEDYKAEKDEVVNGRYLEHTSSYYEEIAKNKVHIRDARISETSYAPAYISANGKITRGQALKNEMEANQFFLSGFLLGDIDRPFITDFTHNYNDYEGMRYIMQQDKESAIYYKNTGVPTRNYDWYENELMYGKTYITDSAAYINKYMGLGSYMTAKRSVFYGKMNTENIPQILGFEQVVGQLSSEPHEWCYSNPIEIFVSGDQRISLDTFCINRNSSWEAYPSIIVNAGKGTLTIEEGNHNNVFRGIIISRGDVHIQGDVNIEGTIIIGGSYEKTSMTHPRLRMSGQGMENVYNPGLLIDHGSKLRINYDPNMLLKIEVAEPQLLREILDALKITQYKNSHDLKEVMGPYKDEVLIYSAGKVFYTTDSTLALQTEDIRVKIKCLRKI